MHSHAALIVCNYRLPDQSILCSFTAGLWHFSAPPLAICQFSKSVFVYSAALRSVHLMWCVSICPRVVHPFHSLSAPFHFFTDTRGEQLLKYVLIRVSFLSLSLLYLFSSVSLSLVQSKATRCSAASCQKWRDSISRPNPFSVFNSLVSRQRGKVGWWCNGTRVSDSGPRVEGPALPNNHFPNRFLNSSTVQNTLKTRSFTVQHIKIRFQRICIFSCMLKTRWKESNGVRKST